MEPAKMAYHCVKRPEESSLDNSAALPDGPRGRDSVRWLGNAALTFVGLAILLAVVGASYQAIEAGADVRRFSQQGKFVDAGGHKLMLNCTGHGRPTVILESG